MADGPLTPATRALADGWRLAAVLSPLGEGHINDTLLAVTADSSRFVLQRINGAVFADPGLVMSNLARIIDHLNARAPNFVPALIATDRGANAHVDGAGDWWRLWRFVRDGRSLSRTTDPAVCRAAGEAFGRFQRLLSDLPGPPLEPTIPGFLELDGYLARLDSALSEPDGMATLARVCGGTGFIDAHRGLAARFPRQQDLIHGDCKLNNLLFAAAAPEVLAVLDLDTVMVGHWAWDLGDLARSVLMGASGAETARPALDALVEGFCRGSRRPIGVETVADAARYVAFMLGVRFLTDHLEGDRYFRVARRGMNADRAREQFDLVTRLGAGELTGGLATPAAGKR